MTLAENGQVERDARTDRLGDLPSPGEAESGQGSVDEDRIGDASATVAYVSSVGGCGGRIGPSP